MKKNNADKMVKYVVGFLREERQRQNINYAKLAEKAGIHYTTISLIERGIQSPSLLVCKKLCLALDVELAPLIKSAEEMLD
jgi:transcriptional regulator with XRE-family HTH domain